MDTQLALIPYVGEADMKKTDESIRAHYYLFATPSFTEGMSRVLDLGSTLQSYNTHDHADALATYLDWLTVGHDLWNAIDFYKHGGGIIEEPRTRRFE